MDYRKACEAVTAEPISIGVHDSFKAESQPGVLIKVESKFTAADVIAWTDGNVSQELWK